MLISLQTWFNMLKTYEPRHDKTNKVTVRPAKTQISLGICPVWSESSLCAQRVAKDPSFLHADSEDSDQTGRMPRLIWVYAGRTLTLLVLSCHGSYHVFIIWPAWTGIMSSWKLHHHILACNSCDDVHDSSVFSVEIMFVSKKIKNLKVIW